jgi:hypothetical protein
VKQLPDIEPVTRSAPERFCAALARGVRRVRPLRAFLLWPVFTRPQYWFATACIFIWGLVLPGRFRVKNGMHYFIGMPKWSFGRGGTTIGAIYLTHENDSDDVIAHEAEHKAQWKRYGLWFIPLYVAAGSDALTNRFEVGADLELGGYVRKRGPKRR